MNKIELLKFTGKNTSNLKNHASGKTSFIPHTDRKLWKFMF